MSTSTLITRAWRAKQYAAGLNWKGKPYRRHPNFWPKLTHAEYMRQWRAARKPGFKNCGAGI